MIIGLLEFLFERVLGTLVAAAAFGKRHAAHGRDRRACRLSLDRLCTANAPAVADALQKIKLASGLNLDQRKQAYCLRTCASTFSDFEASC